MSISEMSATVRAQIVSRLKEVLEAKSPGGITQRKLDSFKDYTSSSQIRSDTDTVGGRHESIMSREAFDNLLIDLQNVVNSSTTLNQLSQAVATISFDGFVSFISEIYYKDKEFLLSDNKRVKNGFAYTGPTRATKDQVAVLARSEDRDKQFKDVLLLKNIPQAKLVEYYVEYIADNTPGITPEAKADLKASLQGGHLTGVFTARLIRAFNLQKDSAGRVKLRGSSNQELTNLEKQLELIVNLLTDADYLSSNIVRDINLFVQTDKRLYSNAAEVRLTTEVQLKLANKQAGDMLATAGRYLSNLINSIKPNVSQTGQELAAQKAFEGLLNNLQQVSQYVKDRTLQLQQLVNQQNLDPEVEKKLIEIINNQKTFETLLTTEGSRSVLQHISDIVIGTIEGSNPIKDSSSSIKVNQSIKLPGAQKTKIKISVPKKPTKKIQTKSPKLKYTSAGNFDSLLNLQNLINSGLVATIKKNMGDGTRRDILNLRSGRFAESVAVERLTQSREGGITAFYNYMRYPYATFSLGGRQDRPRTRDPKLLISSSIREIARNLAITRLRAQLL